MLKPKARAALSWGSRMVPRLVVCGLICGGLYLVLTQFGQVSDLRRALNDGDGLIRHMSTTVGAMAINGLCLTICLGALTREEDGRAPGMLEIVATLLLGASAPAFLVYSTFVSEGDAGVGLVLGSVAVVLPLFMAGKLWFERGDLSTLKWARSLGGIFVLLALLFYAALVIGPVAVGSLMGPIAVLFIVSAVVLWLLWFLSTRTPLLLVVLLGAICVLAYQGVYGVRDVRLLDEQDRRPAAAAHARDWLATRREAILAVPQYPVYFVTADGGGLRAAAWTAEVLGALADENSEFVRHSYLLSGVSGGSLGVALFAAAVADAPGAPASAQAPASAASGAYRARVRAVLSRNLLAAPFGMLLTRDPFESVFCLGLEWARTCSDPPLDRIIALERTVEEAWSQGATRRQFEQSVQALWADRARELDVPALILNTTHAHNGRTHVVSSFVDEAFGPEQDLLSRLPRGKALRLSSAALLSARFPVISPEGSLTLDGKPEHFVDGGYFDNSGGAGAQRALPAFLKAVREAGLQEHVLPVALVITNDGRRQARDFSPAGCRLPRPESPTLKHKLDSLLGQPVGTLDAQRVNASESRRTAWTDAVQKAGGVALEIALFECADTGDFEIPLGWALSDAARQQLQAKVKALQDQADSPYRKVLALLRGSGPP